MRALSIVVTVAVLAGLGCTKGEVNADLDLYLAQGNLDYYEEVLYPSSRRDTYDGIFAGVPLYLPLHLRYETTEVDALITQRGDLQLTCHLASGKLYESELTDLSYLEDEAWNGESEEDRWGQQLFQELDEPGASYADLDEDVRLILLINLPEPEGDDGWSSDGWQYPAELWANYQDTLLDEDDQEFDIPEDEIQLMSRMIIGGELFETINNTRFDEAEGIAVEDPNPNLVLDQLSMPGEDDKFGRAVGSFDLMLEADSFSASAGVASIAGEFDVEIHDDRWALDDLDVQEDLDDTSLSDQ